ncbi:hypothetical protein [Streptomyces pseudogriseolus]|uniref:hypothetical protein n=1 Tax=Streptomyces pseudogriseolus TaxID=36817 RepID=UPI003FA2CFE2
MTTPADELRTAADKLRQLSDAVSAPDDRDQVFHAEGTDVTQGRHPGLYDVATTQTPELASFIAAMHPGVGAALADWLDQAAHYYEAGVQAADDVFRGDPAGREAFLTTGPGAPSEHALAVVRQINAASA